MLPQPDSRHSTIVTGDATVDWNILSDLKPADEPDGPQRSYNRICSQPGGALQLGKLIQAVAPADQWSVHSVELPEGAIHPDDERFSHSYAAWALFPAKPKPAWRVKEFMGIDKASAAPEAVAGWQKVINDDLRAGLIVLDDAALGFRSNQALWPKALFNHDNQPWIILKMASPVAKGDLWDYLHQNWAKRLIVILAVDDLRKTAVQISRELSWERTAQDVAWELVYNPLVNELSDCAHVVVSFRNAGAVLLSQPLQPAEEGQPAPLPECTLFFDPGRVEGMWEKEQKGLIMGSHTCLTAGIARQLMLEKPNLDDGIQAGLEAMRSLHEVGFLEIACSSQHPALTFPTERIAALLAKKIATFSATPVQFPTHFLIGKTNDETVRPPLKPGFWTILQEAYPQPNQLEDLAFDIVEKGAETVLKGAPMVQFARLTTVDRREIESLRSIRSLIKEYDSIKKPPRPLSIAVFGPPGSGKSFGVKQVAKSLKGDDIEIEDMTFNLSQMKSPDQLAGAFHQIRDKGLKGVLPLVFWDEFDTDLDGAPLGWLRYFLAPMQDGEFMEGQLPHPLGRAIFVFAGGTSKSIEEFNRMGKEDFIKAKGPDFVSRLRGFVNIMGANPPDKNGQIMPEEDPYYIIRRAILLRSILSQNAPHLFSNKVEGKGLLSIDRGVLAALLKTRKFKHGARSIEAIINMSLLAGKSRFERSCLPSEDQLNLHVDGQNFTSQLQKTGFEEGRLETLARANHEVYIKRMKANGKSSPQLVPYKDLPEEYKDSNRSAAKDILRKLDLCGYELVNARSNQLPTTFPGEVLPVLAEQEHNRWMAEKLGAKREPAWHYGPDRDESKGVHPCLLPWKEYTAEERQSLFTEEEWTRIGTAILPLDEKLKDFDFVKDIPEIVGKAGFAVVKAHTTEESPVEK